MSFTPFTWNTWKVGPILSKPILSQEQRSHRKITILNISSTSLTMNRRAGAEKSCDDFMAEIPEEMLRGWCSRDTANRTLSLSPDVNNQRALPCCHFWWVSPRLLRTNKSINWRWSRHSSAGNNFRYTQLKSGDLCHWKIQEEIRRNFSHVIGNNHWCQRKDSFGTNGRSFLELQFVTRDLFQWDSIVLL